MSVLKFPRGEGHQLSDHWSVRDFDCHCDFPECEWTYIDTDLIDALEKLWTYLGPFAVTSGFRCTPHNVAIGGKPGSYHLLGKAADVKKIAVVGQRIALAALSVQAFRNGGIGTPSEGDWAHLDVRGYPARWSYPKSGKA